MNNRIRYNKVNDRGVLTSRRAFRTLNGIEVTVELDTTTKTYKIYNNLTREILNEGGRTRNLNVLKIQAKTAMEELGVIFEKEQRAERRR